MNGPQKFDAIITDPDLDSRMRLKQATASVHQFGKVHQVSTLNDASRVIGSNERVDVCFISHRFNKDESRNFIQAARNTKAGQDTAYVLVLRSKDQDASIVATNVLAGVDGFLFEPYSVDQLVDLTLLAAKVRKERMAAREEAALRFLMNEVMNSIDEIAYLKASGFDLGPVMRKLKEQCGVIKTLQGDSVGIYNRLLVDLFIEAPLPKKIFQRKIYSGASSRVKKLQETKIKSVLEKESAQAK